MLNFFLFELTGWRGVQDRYSPSPGPANHEHSGRYTTNHSHVPSPGPANHEHSRRYAANHSHLPLSGPANHEHSGTSQPITAMVIATCMCKNSLRAFPSTTFRKYSRVCPRWPSYPCPDQRVPENCVLDFLIPCNFLLAIIWLIFLYCKWTRVSTWKYVVKYMY